MGDTYTLHLQNFRSIRDAKIDIAPLTVIYGPNGSGKSSLIYGLLTLKNFLTNPNQNVASLFSYPSISLGGLQEVVRGHANDRKVALSIGVSNPQQTSSKFTLSLDLSGGESGISLDTSTEWIVETWPESLNLQIPIPYTANQSIDHRTNVHIVGELSAQMVLAWNGIALAAQVPVVTEKSSQHLKQLNERYNQPMELARQTGFVPIRRGFSKPLHTLGSVASALTTEDEAASLLASTDHRFRQYDISGYMEKIANRRIQIQPQIGTPAFTIDTIPLDGGTPVSIVNEGFGINQLLYMLTICLHSPFKIVAIEEPEIHLHPSLVRKLAHAMIDIATNEDRRLIVSTHSETFVVALLTQIAAGRVGVDDVSFVLAENRDGESAFTQQQATPDGQIQGGLETFIAAGAEDLAIFLGLSGG